MQLAMRLTTKTTGGTCCAFYFPINSMTAAVVALTPVSMVGLGAGQDRAEWVRRKGWAAGLGGYETEGLRIPRRKERYQN